VADQRPPRAWFACAAALAATVLAARASADFASADFGLGRDLEAKLLHGYPLDANAYYGPFTIGLQLRNRGGERSVRIQINGTVNTERTLRVPAHDQVRTFFYLPSNFAYYSENAQLTVTDLATGRSKEIGAGSSETSAAAVARLGPISTALNNSSPWTFFGALDAHMPDDWRGLAGLRAIVVEHGYAMAHAPDWKVLLDWVAMGGLLLVATPAGELGEPAPWSTGDARAEIAFAAPPVETSGGVMQRVGLGTVARVLPEQLATMDAGFVARIGACTSCGWSVNSSDTTAYASSNSARARLKGAVHGPSWRLFSLLSLFVFAVGPGGWLAFVSRRGRPLRYVAFTLGAALAASLIVISDDLIENGIRARCAANSLILVDQRTDTEIGVEDVAMYAPASRGTGLHVPLGVHMLLPRSSDFRDTLQVTVDADRMHVQGALPLRQRRVVAGRWLQPARKRLEVQASGGELWVENQLGYDLSSLVLWHGSDAYRVPKLVRGARARAESIAPQEAAARLPAAASAPAVISASALVRSIAAGDFGQNRFAATYAWAPAQSTLIAADTLPVPGNDHVIAGVYE
jgi:hypothetical protein